MFKRKQMGHIEKIKTLITGDLMGINDIYVTKQKSLGLNIAYSTKKNSW